MPIQPGKHRVGIVGTGTIATSVHIPVIHNIPDADIAWVADASETLARKVGSHNRTASISVTEIEAQLGNCDVVLLAIPLLPRAGYFDLLHNKEVAVLSEKPLALNAGDHKKYAELFGDRRLSICYARRFHGTSRFLRSALTDRTFGLPKVIRVAEGGIAGRTGGAGTYQDESSERGGGITLNLACHALDCVFWMTGATSYEILSREIEWDGDTDRRLKAQILLKDLHGHHGEQTRLDIIVSNLDTLANMMDFEFDGLTLRCPVAASDHFEVISHGRPLEASLCSTEGAKNSMESYYQLWRNVLCSHQAGVVSDVSARSSIVMAQLMDELLTR